MKLFDLVSCCYNWDENSRLVIVYADEEAVTMTVSEARKSFANYEVAWFRENVVVLL